MPLRKNRWRGNTVHKVKYYTHTHTHTHTHIYIYIYIYIYICNTYFSIDIYICTHLCHHHLRYSNTYMSEMWLYMDTSKFVLVHMCAHKLELTKNTLSHCMYIYIYIYIYICVCVCVCVCVYLSVYVCLQMDETSKRRDRFKTLFWLSVPDNLQTSFIIADPQPFQRHKTDIHSDVRNNNLISDHNQIP